MHQFVISPQKYRAGNFQRCGDFSALPGKAEQRNEIGNPTQIFPKIGFCPDAQILIAGNINGIIGADFTKGNPKATAHSGKPHLGNEGNVQQK